MRRVLAYLLIGLVLLLLQTTLLPAILPWQFKPDLLLILAIYLGLEERCLRGGLLAYGLGFSEDAFAGVFPGLYGLVLLLIFLAVRGAGGRLNTESSLLLLVMTFCGTLLQGGLLAFCLGFFAEAGSLWSYVLGLILPQALLNLAAALVLLKGAILIQRRFAPRFGIPGLRHLDRRYES